MQDFLELTQGLLKNNDFEEKAPTIPDGDYTVELANVLKKTSQNGNEYISLVLKVTDGEYTNRTIYDNIFFTPKTAEGNIKRIYKLAEMSSVDLVPFTDVDSIVTFMTSMMGSNYNISYAENSFHKVTFNSIL